MSSEAASPDEATSSDAKTSGSPADADRTVVKPAESVTSSSESEYLEFQNSDAENSPPAPRPSQPSDEQRCVFTVLCPPDGGPWARFTCALAFVAALICDGVCLSLFLLDSRVGMAEYLPPRTYTIEHAAAVTMFRYVIGTDIALQSKGRAFDVNPLKNSNFTREIVKKKNSLQFSRVRYVVIITFYSNQVRIFGIYSWATL